MLDKAVLRALTSWCRDRRLRWFPVQDGGGEQVMLLEPVEAPAAWQRLRLVCGRTMFSLEDEPGRKLATASGLPALLDALDGGVAEPEPPLYGPPLPRPARPMASLVA